ncbi:MAG: glycosyltransferase [Planctomycetes bacterium]|nr:glycosyltransferase [Planctomycetota bacterium]
MRIAFFAKRHKRSGITTHMERAMRSLGHEVLRVNRRKLERVIGKGLAWKLIRRRVRRFRPDVVLVFTFDLPAERLNELRQDAKTATFFDDCPRELGPRIEGAARASDVFFITSRGQISQYVDELGITPAYVTGGCDPEDHFRVPAEQSLISDVAFIGKPDSRGGRVEVLKELAKHYDVAVYGPRWREVGLTPRLDDVYPPQYRQICNSARVVLGNDLRDDVELYFSNRTWISLGCGAFLCTRYVPKLEEILTEGEHCVFFRSPADAVEVVGRYLEDDAARSRIAAAGHAYAHEQYSYARMIERMLAHPDLAPPS